CPSHCRKFGTVFQSKFFPIREYHIKHKDGQCHRDNADEIKGRLSFALVYQMVFIVFFHFFNLSISPGKTFCGTVSPRATVCSRSLNVNQTIIPTSGTIIRLKNDVAWLSPIPKCNTKMQYHKNTQCC